MGILDLLKTEKECQARLAELRQLGQHPTVLYGAGVYAREVRGFLGSLGVSITGSFIDETCAIMPGKDVLKPSSFEEIDGRLEDYNVVVAFCGDPYAAAERVQNKRSHKVRSVQVIDCRFWERFSSLKRSWVDDHREALEALYGWLGDDRSRQTLAAFINAKLMFDPTPLKSLRSSPQYFPEDLPGFRPATKDIFVDVGAYDGDTLAQVVTMMGGRGPSAYYAFEPDSRNNEKVLRYAQDKRLGFVHLMPLGLWNSAGRVRFQEYHDSRSYITDKGRVEIEVGTLDSLSLPATFVKMDIEGSEWEALQGAAGTIAATRPKIAVALYHDPEHLIRIPHLLKRLCPNYTFYLRAHSLFSEELVLYAMTTEEKTC